LFLYEISRLEEALKSEKPWIGCLDAALTGGFIKVDSAAGTQPATLGPTERLNRQVQQDIFPQEPRQVDTIVLQELHIHLLSNQLDLIAAEITRGSHVEDLKFVRYRYRDRLGTSAAMDNGRGSKGAFRQDSPALPEVHNPSTFSQRGSSKSLRSNPSAGIRDRSTSIGKTPSRLGKYTEAMLRSQGISTAERSTIPGLARTCCPGVGRRKELQAAEKIRDLNGC